MVGCSPARDEPLPALPCPAYLQVTGSSSLASLSVTGTASLASLNATGAAALSSLSVTGATSLASLNATAAATLAALTVTGSTSLASLSTTGAATLAGLTVTGSSLLGATFINRTSDGPALTLDATAGSLALVTADSVNISGQLTASGGLDARGGATLLGSTTIEGSSTQQLQVCDRGWVAAVLGVPQWGSRFCSCLAVCRDIACWAPAECSCCSNCYSPHQWPCPACGTALLSAGAGPVPSGRSPPGPCGEGRAVCDRLAQQRNAPDWISGGDRRPECHRRHSHCDWAQGSVPGCVGQCQGGLRAALASRLLGSK